jgi:hypothetical protein
MTGSVLELGDIQSGVFALPTPYATTYVVFPAICCHKIQLRMLLDAARSKVPTVNTKIRSANSTMTELHIRMVESIAIRRSFSQKAEYVDEQSSQPASALAAKLESYMRLDITKKESFVPPKK